MIFSSGVFLMIFLPLTMLVYFCPLWKKSIGVKNIILLIASLVFYTWGEPKAIVVMILGVVIDYFAGRFIEDPNRKGRTLVFTLTVVYSIAVLFVYKYLSFLLGELQAVREFSFRAIALPIGISFYTFQMLSYLIDVYRGTVKAEKSFTGLALYITMFPQLVAGPIVRYETISKEIKDRSVSLDDFYYGTCRFIIGLGKKILIADEMALIADNIFATQEVLPIATLGAWLGAVAYTLQIYFDFSGYSDMAIGMARCFGFHFEENFRYPLASSSVTDFWRRWHISLTSWFRDYVYIPLGGNRVKPARHFLNIIIVWALTGIWHGANWTFLVWGLINCAFILFEKYTGLPRRIPKWGGYVITPVFCTLMWVCFRADSLGQAVTYWSMMFGKSGTFADADSLYYLQQSARILAIAIAACLPWPALLAKPIEHIRGKRAASVFIAFKSVFLVAVLVLSIMSVIDGAYSPFIYYRF